MTMHWRHGSWNALRWQSQGQGPSQRPSPTPPLRSALFFRDLAVFVGIPLLEEINDPCQLLLQRLLQGTCNRFAILQVAHVNERRAPEHAADVFCKLRPQRVFIERHNVARGERRWLRRRGHCVLLLARCCSPPHQGRRFVKGA